MHRITAYKKSALWDEVEKWFNGGPAASGRIDSSQSALHTFEDRGGSTWQIYLPETPREEKASIDWKAFATPVALDELTYGYRWSGAAVTPQEQLTTLPEYFRLETGPNGKKRWQAVPAAEVSAETGLADVRFGRPRRRTATEPYVTPDEPESSWKTPGPAAGPFEAVLGDGSVVTYYWYRFADQPALLNADMTPTERELMQQKVELLHRHWKKDGEYLPPNTVGKLADLDPALLVTPPAGLEVGYVPIVTRQGLKQSAN